MLRSVGVTDLRVVATAGLAEAASLDPTVSVVSVQDRVVFLAGERVEYGLLRGLAPSRRPAPARGRVAWGRFALFRVLLRTPRPRTQIDLATECGVSQVAISNALRALDTAVTRETGGWHALRPDALWEQFLTKYPGPQGITSYWMGLGSITRQAQAAQDAAAELDVLLSGDPAADLIAPWRMGRRAVVYAQTGLDLAQFGFSETTRENATLECVVPADPTIWSTARAWTSTGSGWIADPVLVAWDVQRTGGPDAADAVERIRRAVLAGWLP